jgi:hypothetical protein
MNSILFLGDTYVVSSYGLKSFNLMVEKLRASYPDSTIIANLECAIEVDESAKRPFGKAVPIVLKQEVFKNYPLIKYSPFNNHFSDCGIKNAHTAIEIFPSIIQQNPLKGIFFFVDLYEDCVCINDNFISFKLDNIVKYAKYFTGTHVIVHGGLEYSKYPTVRLKMLAERCVDLGAKSVNFTHTHTDGIVQSYNGTAINWGIREFIFESGVDSGGCSGAFLHLTCDDVKIMELDSSGDIVERDSSILTLPDVKSYQKQYASLIKPRGIMRPRQNSRYFWINDINFRLWRILAKCYVEIKWRFGK